MIRLTVSGKTYDLKHYMGHLEEDRIYQIVDRSQPIKSRRDDRTFRVFVNIEKKTKLSAREKMLTAGCRRETALCAK